MKVLFLTPPLKAWDSHGLHKAANQMHAQVAAYVRNKKIADVVALAATRCEMGQAVEFHGAADIEFVASGAPSALRRMLDNLVDNAVRYAGRARVTVSAEPEFIVVSVEDDGPGVPAEALLSLVTPFERLETSRARHTGGVGLGLSIVKALVESQGGSMTLQNRDEGGLRVTLRLPAQPRLQFDTQNP